MVALKSKEKNHQCSCQSSKPLIKQQAYWGCHGLHQHKFIWNWQEHTKSHEKTWIKQHLKYLKEKGKKGLQDE